MKWEYKVRDFRPAIHGSLEAYLNDLGSDGWELVSHTLERNIQPSDENHGHSYRDMSYHFLVLKRLTLG